MIPSNQQFKIIVVCVRDIKDNNYEAVSKHVDPISIDTQLENLGYDFSLPYPIERLLRYGQHSTPFTDL